MAQGPTPTRWPMLLAICALAYLVSLVFWPMLGFQFVESDVLAHVVDNHHIRGLTAENLKHIFTSRCITSYYPVRTLTYALDYQLWGLNPAGFKLTGGLIHLANVLLVFWLVLRLLRQAATTDGYWRACWDVFAAAFSAGLCAVHPVVVEPVVWVAGREELLMTLGALGCVHFHLGALRFSQHGGRPRSALACHLAAALSCAAACLSNAVGAVIPLLILAWDLLTPAKPKWRTILCGTAPLWAIGIITLAIKGPGDEAVLAREVGTLSPQRLMLVLKVYWLNLHTLAWPTELALSYGRLTPESSLNAEVILGGIAVCLTCVALWKLRRQALILFGLLWFGLALGPTSQLLPHHIHRADRFLYLPLVGLAVALGVGIRPLVGALKPWPIVAGAVAIGGSCLVALTSLSVSQVHSWRDSVSVWEQCVSVAPNNPDAHRALADSLAKRGRFREAIPHYQRALEIEPEYIDVMRNFAFYLVTCRNEELRDDDLAIRLAERGCDLTQWEDANLLRTLAMAYTNYAATLQRGGQFRPAVQYYNMAIEADPDYDLAMFNLAFLLATCVDEDLRDPRQAVRLAERACRLVNRPNAVRLSILAAAYAATGRFDEAVTVAHVAIQRAEAAGDVDQARQLRRHLELYQDRSPYRDEP